MSTGFSVFLGVLAGTAVDILVRLWFQRRSETQQTRNLKFELELNIRKIDEWLAELERYRNAVNSDALNSYFGYFDLSRVVLVTASSMLQTGLLYKKLTHNQIETLQVVASDFSIFGQQYLSNQMAEDKQAFESCRAGVDMNLWATRFKPEVFVHIEFWRDRFLTRKGAIEEIVTSLR